MRGERQAGVVIKNSPIIVRCAPLLGLWAYHFRPTTYFFGMLDSFSAGGESRIPSYSLRRSMNKVLYEPPITRRMASAAMPFC